MTNEEVAKRANAIKELKSLGGWKYIEDYINEKLKLDYILYTKPEKLLERQVEMRTLQNLLKVINLWEGMEVEEKFIEKEKPLYSL